jgi:hypothetical protein
MPDPIEIRHESHTMAKSKCCCSIWQRKGPGTKSISAVAKVAWYNINFIGIRLYRKEVRTDSNYRICASSILYGPVSPPARIATADRVRCSERDLLLKPYI